MKALENTNLRIDDLSSESYKDYCFSDISINYTWSFSDKTIKDTSYITHGYYTYPAKFIPQLATRLIIENSIEGDIVVDPFMGSGTTIVESIINKRVGIGIDINEIAFLISKVKTTPLDGIALNQSFFRLFENLSKYQSDHMITEVETIIPINNKIDYWFLPEEKLKLAIILNEIRKIEDSNLQDFYLVAFSQILKSCSIWMQKSIKPTRDLKKNITNPIDLFISQSKKMINKHLEFNKILNPLIKQNIDLFRKVQCSDSRNIPCEDEKASLIVTSPPYVTSYEYADLHQLPSVWLGYMSELGDFRKKFIGSAYKDRSSSNLKSDLANETISKLKNKKNDEVNTYFLDMLESFIEMKRILKKGGRVCIVIGNTEFKGVKILNAEIFKEQLENIGFKTHDIIKREIPSKMLPSTRDNITGRFVSSKNSNIKLAYPTEYILIMEKL